MTVMSMMSTSYCLAGESFHIGHSTRLVIHSDDKRVSFPVKNGTTKPLVFHGQVLDQSKKKFSPYFVVTPEIKHINQGEEQWIQIVNLGAELPKDRETLFYLQGHFIPSVRPVEKITAGLNFSYEIHMKLFYRPKDLKAEEDAIDEHANKLNFFVEDGRLIAKNESPYYMTINTLSSEEKSIDVPDNNCVIEPFGKLYFDLNNFKPNTITWTLVNDGGYSTEPITRKL